MRALSTRERKLIAVGISLALVALVWSLVLAPVVDGFAERSRQREELRTAYARNSRLINAIPAMRRHAERQRAMSGAFLLVAPNASLARDRMRDRMRSSFAAAGGQVTAVQDVPAAPGSVRAWVQGRMTLPQLQSLLVAVNDTRPYLIVESLRVSADRALETGHLDILDVRLEASIPFVTAAS